MKKTNIFASEEELEELQQLSRAAARTPVIALSSADALSGNDFASQAWRRAQERCHKVALSHGLPEISGFYGLTREGEFVVV